MCLSNLAHASLLRADVTNPYADGAIGAHLSRNIVVDDKGPQPKGAPAEPSSDRLYKVRLG